MYNAIVTKIHVEDHPNADRLQVGFCCGSQVIVGLDTQEGDLGIFFPCDGQLSKEFAEANDLVAYRDPETGKNKGGFFAANRRVRAQNFRQVKSDGFWCPLSYLEALDVDVSSLKDGDTLVEIDGIPICNKYETPATKKAQGQQKTRKLHPSFPKHYETEQYAYNKDRIPQGSIITITEKVHGTSGRFGYVKVREEITNNWFRNLVRLKPKVVEEFHYVNGSRNVVLKEGMEGFYESEGFRNEVTKPFVNCLKPGEVVYYEIVGYTDTGQKIMPDHPTEKLDEEFRERWGDTCSYLYGCSYGDIVRDSEYKERDIYVYRIAVTNEEGTSQDLSWSEVKKRCSELGVNHVPELYQFSYNKNSDACVGTPGYHYITPDFIDDVVESLFAGPSLLDLNTHKEGVCLRITPPIGSDYVLKHKNWEFKVMEGIAKESDDYVDTEESS